MDSLCLLEEKRDQLVTVLPREFNLKLTNLAL
jgi:hypothetical protein